MTSTQMRTDRDTLARAYAIRMAAIYAAPKRSRARLTRILRNDMNAYRNGGPELTV